MVKYGIHFGVDLEDSAVYSAIQDLRCAELGYWAVEKSKLRPHFRRQLLRVHPTDIFDTGATSVAMGWLPSFLGGENSSDPVRNLDPKLREFLEKESPVKYTTAEPSPAARPPPPPQTKHAQPSVAADGAAEPAVPSASLYKDGRYAHLWKTYRPLAQIEAETASDHDRLMNVLDGFKERKAAIGRTALENCALHQEEWVNCMKHGAWEDQLTMCRDKVRRFEKCYDMQAVGRPPNLRISHVSRSQRLMILYCSGS